MKNIITLILSFLTSALLINFYFVRTSHEPGWMKNGIPGPLADTLILELKNANLHGLDPADYHTGEIEKLRAQLLSGKNLPVAQTEAAKKLEYLLTVSFITYTQHLYAGRMHSTFHNIYIRQHSSRINPADSLQKVLRDGGMRSMLQSFVCLHPQYTALKKELGRHLQIKQNGGWPLIPSTMKIKAGDKSKFAALLRKRLEISGDMKPAKPGNDSLFDTQLEEAVIAFKHTHGLRENSLIDAELIREMNVTVDERINQISMNMERWRWLPRVLEKNFIMANIAGLNLAVVSSNREVMRMKIIAGKYKTKTPLFHAHMSHIIINPWWEVPSSIARKEIVYDIRKNPSYLQNNHIRLYSGGREINPNAVNWTNYGRTNFPFRLRQTPGPWNSLGHIKFVFPNPYDVYFHDTPARNLFSVQVRTFSHGCIRIEKPVELAAFLLHKDTVWVKQAITTDAPGYPEKLFRLHEIEEVYICYWTSWVDEQNRLCFARDIYHYDK